MSSTAIISPELIQAYRATHYHVIGDPPFVLHIDVFSPALAALYTKFQIDCAAFLTASNPYSHVVEDTVNAQRQSSLAKILATRKPTYIEGAGKHPFNDWPAEASFLVLGLALDASRTLGREYGQNAIVWCGPDAIPRLVLLR